MRKDNFNLMTVEEEQELFKRIEYFKKNGIELDNSYEYQEIVTRLYELHVRLMYKVASRFVCGRYNAITRDDLVCSSYEAFLNAISKYNYKKEARFSTFLYRAVSDSMRRYMQKYAREISVPIRIQERYSKIQRCEGEFKTQYGREPLMNELCKMTGFSCEEIKDVKEHMTPIYCLDNTMDDGLKNYLDILVDPSTQTLN